MRRVKLALLLLVTSLVLMLFCGDYLTGREHYEYQDPYSRSRKVSGRRYGLRYGSLDENVMSKYYYGELKQPRYENLWERSNTPSYVIMRWTGKQDFDQSPIAPVMFLDVDKEVAFLRHLPNDKVRLAVIKSLWRPRQKGYEPAVQKANNLLAEKEKARVRLIYNWAEIYKDNPSKSFLSWWRDNAPNFGITTEGDPLPVPPTPIVAPTPEDTSTAPNDPTG